MTFRARGPGTDPIIIDEWDGGFGWIAHPTETMQRASHVLIDNDELWLIDPLDATGIDDILRNYGPVAGIIVLLDRHTRDATTLARRHDVPIYVPGWLEFLETKISDPIKIVWESIGDTNYRFHRLVDLPLWREAMVIDDNDGTLIVGDALGTPDYFCTPEETIGVHPLLRWIPPRRQLSDVTPNRILVGHGTGIFERATDQMRDALSGSRKRIPRLYLQFVRGTIPTLAGGRR